MTIDVGTTIAGRYRLESLLGKGGMAKVFVAMDMKFDEEVALKLASPGPNPDEFLARFRREAKIGQLLGTRSSGFVRALDWGSVGGYLYLVMDLVEGSTDLDLTSGSRADRLARFSRVVSLVKATHAVRVVHRDLKPQNCLEAGDGKIYLADFGLAKVIGHADFERDEDFGSVTQTGTAMGTPYYMAPEQIVDASSVDERADIYSLGVMLFLALTGKLPYSGGLRELIGGQTAVELGHKPQPAPKDHDRGIPDYLNELCLEATQIDVNKRLRTVEELLLRLDVAPIGMTSLDGLPPEGLQAALQAARAGQATVNEGPPQLSMPTQAPPPRTKRAGGGPASADAGSPRAARPAREGSPVSARTSGKHTRPTTGEQARPPKGARTSGKRTRPTTGERARPTSGEQARPAKGARPSGEHARLSGGARASGKRSSAESAGRATGKRARPVSSAEARRPLPAGGAKPARPSDSRSAKRSQPNKGEERKARRARSTSDAHPLPQGAAPGKPRAARSTGKRTRASDRAARAKPPGSEAPTRPPPQRAKGAELRASESGRAPGPGAGARPSAGGRPAARAGSASGRNARSRRAPSSGQHARPGGRSSGAHRIPSGEAHPLLPTAAGLLAVLATDVSVEGAEVRFSHAGASGRFGFAGPRLEGMGWGFLERRVHFDALDPPGGLHNLRYAANTINAEGLGGVRAILLPNAIALRRTILVRATVISVESLGPELDRLFGEQVPILDGVDRLLMRQPWDQALETRRLAAAAARTDQLVAIERMLDVLGERHGPCEEGVRASDVVISRSTDVVAEASAGNWSGGQDEDLAIAGQPSPAVERLLQSLNARNRTVPYALCWRPGGVWIHTSICGRRLAPPDLAQLLALTRHAVATEGTDTKR